MIKELAQNEVFVFGTNPRGFHGAGAAGYAMLHVHGNKWRTTKVPGTNKLLNEVPNGTKGYWAVKGVSRGLMQGLYGKSYGIVTVSRPGARRSVPLEEIKKQLLSLKLHSIKHPYTYFLTRIGCGYAGYSNNEILTIIKEVDFPDNIIIPPNTYNTDSVNNT